MRNLAVIKMLMAVTAAGTLVAGCDNINQKPVEKPTAPAENSENTDSSEKAIQND